MTDTFATGSSGDRFVTADHEGQLVMFLGNSEERFEGEYGEQMVARSQITIVLDSPDGVEVFHDSLIFGKALAPSVYRPGKPVLGIIGKGEAKGGGNPPWLLLEPSEVDLKTAEKFYKDNVQETNGKYRYTPDESPF